MRAEIPEAVSTHVQEDTVATKLAVRALSWLPAAGYSPPSLLGRAAFRMIMRGNFLAAPAYLLRLSLSPTEEDWQADGRLSPSSFLDVVRRPFRLARKYGRRSRT